MTAPASRPSPVVDRLRMALAEMGYPPESVALIDGIVQLDECAGVPFAAHWRAGVVAGFTETCWPCWFAWHRDYPNGDSTHCTHPIVLSDAPLPARPGDPR